MAQIVITIPDEKVQEALLRVSTSMGYADNILDENGNSIPNPQTRAQFVKSEIIRHLKRLAKNAIQAEAEQGLSTQADTDTDALGIS